MKKRKKKRKKKKVGENNGQLRKHAWTKNISEDKKDRTGKFISDRKERCNQTKPLCDI